MRILDILISHRAISLPHLICSFLQPVCKNSYWIETYSFQLNAKLKSVINLLCKIFLKDFFLGMEATPSKEHMSQHITFTSLHFGPCWFVHLHSYASPGECHPCRRVQQAAVGVRVSSIYYCLLFHQTYHMGTSHKTSHWPIALKGIWDLLSTQVWSLRAGP